MGMALTNRGGLATIIANPPKRERLPAKGREIKMISNKLISSKIYGATSDEENLLIRTLIWLPTSHIDAINRIEIMSKSDFDDSLRELGEVYGYMTQPGSIAYLIRESCGNLLLYVAMHEIGHLVWFYLLTKEQQDDFKEKADVIVEEEMERQYDEIELEYPVDMYEYTEEGNPLLGIFMPDPDASNEPFADSYAKYILAPSILLEQYPNVYDWLKENVFFGVSYLWLEKHRGYQWKNVITGNYHNKVNRSHHD